MKKIKINRLVDLNTKLETKGTISLKESLTINNFINCVIESKNINLKRKLYVEYCYKEWQIKDIVKKAVKFTKKWIRIGFNLLHKVLSKLEDKLLLKIDKAGLWAIQKIEERVE